MGILSAKKFNKMNGKDPYGVGFDQLSNREDGGRADDGVHVQV